AVSTERDEFLFTGILLWLEHHEGLGDFPPPGIWHPDHGRFEHSRVVVEYSLYFHRRNVFTTTDNYVLGAVNDLNVPIRVHDRQISTVEPSTSHGLRCFLRLLIVALHDIVAARYNLAHGLAIPRHLMQLLVHDAHVSEQLRNALPCLETIACSHIA